MLFEAMARHSELAKNLSLSQTFGGAPGREAPPRLTYINCHGWFAEGESNFFELNIFWGYNHV